MKIRKLTIAFTLGLGLTLALVWLLGGGLPVARAASFTVDVTHDENDGSCSDGDCSLRDAIIEANGNGEADSITLGAGSHVLTLTGTGENGSATGDLDITGPLTITGLGPSQTIIDASGVISDRVLDIRSGAGTVVISGVTIMNGNITGLGGGIYNYDAGLTLVNVIVSSNVATGTWPNGHGGGVYVYQGSVTLQDGQIVSNTAVEYGGGLFVNRDTAAFTQTGDSIIAHNVVTGSHSSAGGGVYIWDGSVSLNGGQVFANTAGSRGGGVRVGDAGASATLSGTLILSNTAGDGGGGVYVGAGSVKLSGGQVLSNTAGDGGGGVYVYDGSATLSGQIFNNTADVGGGVYVYDGSVTLSGGQIVSNSATWNGGGVYLSAGAAAFTQTGVSTITHNHADYGGGVYMLNGNATLSSGQILSNSATWNGGGVYVNNGSVTLSGGQIVSNTAGNAGGGVYVANSSAAFTQTGSSAIACNNTPSGPGGGVYVNNGSVTLSGGQIVSNTAGSSGGGVEVVNSNASLVQTGDSIIAHNRAGSDGGGVRVVYGSATLEGGQIVSNTAGDDGGGVYVSNSNGVVTQTGGSVIVDNYADDSGGGVYVRDGTAVLEGGQVVSNTADYGGGVYNENGTLTMLNATVSGNRAASGAGGGLYSNAGASAITYTTIASNTASSGGGGIHQAGGVVLLQNTIVACNGNNCGGTLVSNGHNLDSGATCGFTATGDVTGADPLLGPLTADGGTLVHPLIVGSPAIDEGLCLPAVTTVDQRGVTRPQGYGCDIGAYEAERPVITVTKSGPARFSPQDRITYTLYVTNTGTLTATHVVLTDTLPTGAAFVTASDGGVAASGIVTWPVFSVPPGDGLVTRTFAVTATATITNADYRVSCAGGVGVAGSVVVVTEIGDYKIYLPLVLRNHQ